MHAAARPETISTNDKNAHATRETVESIVVAVILAFLFRAFVAEAFVIPTGSMAPTLQGRHMDVTCEQCGHQYRTGASSENRDNSHIQEVESTTCPVCRYTMELQKKTNPNQRSFNGDRILVSKFSYLLGEPERWDVIVFKYPGNAKQNYIKRLIGLPNEDVRIRHGDILVRPNNGDDSQPFAIERKPPHKVRAMLQLVDDTDFRPEALQEAGWPERWQAYPASSESTAWQANEAASGFTLAASDSEQWLRYRHLVPGQEDWEAIEEGRRPERLDDFRGQLITDYYEYNDSNRNVSPYGYSRGNDPQGLYWVGDLALECEVAVKGSEGELLLDLVEGGTHYGCRIDVSTGVATLSIGGGGKFRDDTGNELEHPEGKTAVRQPGHYQLRFANVDDQVLLWVNNRLVSFAGPTTYESLPDVSPQWTPSDPGDLLPVGIGGRGVELHAERLRVLRDVYYIAVSSGRDTEYYNQFGHPNSFYKIQEIFADPTQWNHTDLFDSRMTAEFPLEADQYFPLGDNSPQSKDARLWSVYGQPPAYVDGELLIGKALLIYWPHAWRTSWFALPVLPNFNRMRFIR
jgi:signal peptidase I